MNVYIYAYIYIYIYIYIYLDVKCKCLLLSIAPYIYIYIQWYYMVLYSQRNDVTVKTVKTNAMIQLIIKSKAI